MAGVEEAQVGGILSWIVFATAVPQSRFPSDASCPVTERASKGHPVLPALHRRKNYSWRSAWRSALESCRGKNKWAGSVVYPARDGTCQLSIKNAELSSTRQGRYAEARAKFLHVFHPIFSFKVEMEGQWNGERKAGSRVTLGSSGRAVENWKVRMEMRGVEFLRKSVGSYLPCVLLDASTPIASSRHRDTCHRAPRLRPIGPAGDVWKRQVRLGALNAKAQLPGPSLATDHCRCNPSTHRTSHISCARHTCHTFPRAEYILQREMVTLCTTAVTRPSYVTRHGGRAQNQARLFSSRAARWSAETWGCADPTDDGRCYACHTCT